MVEKAFAVGGHKQVDVAVVVVITSGDAHAESTAGNAGFFRHVGEGAVVVVAIQGVAKRFLGLEEIGRPAVHQVDVHPAVVVVVEEGTARAERFGEIALFGHCIVVDPCDSARSRGQLFKQRSSIASWQADGEEKHQAEIAGKMSCSTTETRRARRFHRGIRVLRASRCTPCLRGE